MKVLNFGSLNYDYVYNVDHMVQPGETLAAQALETFCGGKGLNQSIALAKAGAQVYHAGLIGEDGARFLEICHDNKIDTTYIRQMDGKSGHTIIQVDKSAQNCILLYGGSNRCITEDFIHEALSDFSKGDILLLQNEVNFIDLMIEEAYKTGMTIALNPSPFDSALDKCDMSKVSIFLMNEIEGKQMTGCTDPDEILAAMRDTYPNAQVVLTMGKDGVIYQYKEILYQQDIFPVTAIDTTAAGDTFTGYFIAGLLAHMPMPDILRRCAKASSIAVSRKGASSSIPALNEVNKELQDI